MPRPWNDFGGGLVRAGRRGAEVVSETDAKLLVHPHRLHDVALPFEGPHQQAVPGFAVGRACNQPPSRLDRNRQLGSSNPEPDARVTLDRSEVDLLKPAAIVVDPRRALTAKELPLADRVGRQRRSGGLGPTLAANESFGPVNRVDGRLHV